jgi:fructose-bisphosphate aldolase class II
MEAILEAGSYNLGPKSRRIDNPEEWTEDKIRANAKSLPIDQGPVGDFED